MRLWDTATGAARLTIEDKSDRRVEGPPAFSPDGRRLRRPGVFPLPDGESVWVGERDYDTADGTQANVGVGLVLKADASFGMTAGHAVVCAGKAGTVARETMRRVRKAVGLC